MAMESQTPLLSWVSSATIPPWPFPLEEDSHAFAIIAVRPTARTPNSVKFIAVALLLLKLVLQPFDKNLAPTTVACLKNVWRYPLEVSFKKPEKNNWPFHPNPDIQTIESLPVLQGGWELLGREGSD